MEWISTKKELPNIPEGQMLAVMGYDGYRQVLVNFYNDEGQRFRVDCLKCFNEVTYQITHWKYLDSDPPIKWITWQAKAKNSDEWLDISDEEYEQTQHLVRFEFRRVEK